MIVSLFDGQQKLEVVESVCSVLRLSEVLQFDFSTIPVVNMHGSLLGLVPKHFIITLIQQHCWYEEFDGTNEAIERLYKTGVDRKENNSDDFENISQLSKINPSGQLVD